MILVTGGCGFVGSHLVKKLIMGGHSVTVLDDLSNSTNENLPPEVTFIKGDVRNFDLLKHLMEQTTLCYHLAAITSVNDCEIAHYNAYNVNVQGTYCVFEAAVQSSQKPPVIYASSAAVYGDLYHEDGVHEEMSVNPLGLYGHSKHLMEIGAKFYGKHYQLKSLGLRFFNIYGYPFGKSSYGGVVRAFLLRLKDKKDLVIYGNGQQIRDFIYIDDIIKACTKLKFFTNCSAPVMNVCTGKTISIYDLALILKRIFPENQSNIHFESVQQGDILISKGSNKKILEHIPHFNFLPLEKGLQKLIKDFLKDQ